MNTVSSTSSLAIAILLAIASIGQANAQTTAPRRLCLPTIRDQSAPNNCIPASSVQTLGMLYPLSLDFNIDAQGSIATGRIGPYYLFGYPDDRALTIDVGASSTFGGGPIIELARFSSTSGVGNGDIQFINSHNTSEKLIAMIEAITVGSSTDKGGAIYFSTKEVNSGLGIAVRMVIQDEGNVGIGTQAPTERLHVIGNILASGTITPSDARFKDNVVEIENALALVRELRGVRYDWNRPEFPDRGFSDRRQLGFIAQEVNEVLPEVVTEGSDGYLALDYSKLTPVLAGAVQELATRVDEQQEEIEELRSRVAELEQVRRDVAILKASLCAR